MHDAVMDLLDSMICHPTPGRALLLLSEYGLYWTGRHQSGSLANPQMHAFHSSLLDLVGESPHRA